MLRRTEGGRKGVVIDQNGRLDVNFEALAEDAGIELTLENCRILWVGVASGLAATGYRVRDHAWSGLFSEHPRGEKDGL